MNQHLLPTVLAVVNDSVSGKSAQAILSYINIWSRSCCSVCLVYGPVRENNINDNENPMTLFALFPINNWPFILLNRVSVMLFALS